MNLKSLRLLSLATLALMPVDAWAQSKAALPTTTVAETLPAELVTGRTLRDGVQVHSDNPLLVPDYPAAARAFEAAIALGGPTLAEAQVSLAKMLLTGQAGPADLSRAEALLTTALDSGNGEAGFVLGNQLALDPARGAETIAALETALRLGYFRAGLPLADALRASDPDRAASLRDLTRSLLEQQIAAGDASAAFALADYLRGDGGDLSEALRLYQVANELGHNRALFWMARLQADAASPLFAPEAATTLYDQAAQSGSLEAARELVIAADAGTLPVEPARASYWMDQLLDANDTTARLIYADQVEYDLDQRRALSDTLFAQLMADPAPDVGGLLEAGSRFRDGNGLVVDIERALALFDRGVSLGDKDAVVRFGELVLAYPGLQTPENAEKAYREVNALFETDSVSGAVLLAEMLSKGVGVSIDRVRATELYETAANASGSVTAMMALADLYRSSTDETERVKALAWLQQAADRGSVTALTTLAEAYANGTLVGRDRLRAIALYEQAIDAGAGTALDALANLYLLTGGDAAMELAGSVYERAIRNDFPDAAINYADFLIRTGQASRAISILERPEFDGRVDVALALAQLYTGGQAGKIDLARAAAWLDTAYANVGEDPKQRIAVAAAMITSSEQSARIRAIEMLNELLEAKVPEAARYLGQAYLGGLGVAADPAKGVQYYLTAIRLGDADARIELAGAYSGGTQLPVDIDAAVGLYQEVLEIAPNDPSANLRLGHLYADGMVGSRDMTKALEYYTRAAEAGDTSAQFELGNAYLWGAGVAQDAAEASRWLQSASHAGSVKATVTLASLHSSAIAAKVDPTTSFALNLDAARKSDPTAMIEVGIALVSGFGVGQDSETGIAWLEQASALGSEAAMLKLYDIYHDGLGVPADAAKASQWLDTAAQIGSGGALYRQALPLLDSAEQADKDAAIALLWQAAGAQHNQAKKVLVSLGLMSAADAEAE